MKIIFIFIFNSDDELLLNKMIDISSMTFLVVGAVLNENNILSASFLKRMSINYRRECGS